MFSDNALQCVSLFSVATSPGSISGALRGISKLHLVHAARILPDRSSVMGRRGGNELTLPNSLIAVRLQSQYKRATVTIPRAIPSEIILGETFSSPRAERPKRLRTTGLYNGRDITGMLSSSSVVILDRSTNRCCAAWRERDTQMSGRKDPNVACPATLTHDRLTVQIETSATARHRAIQQIL